MGSHRKTCGEHLSESVAAGLRQNTWFLSFEEVYKGASARVVVLIVVTRTATALSCAVTSALRTLPYNRLSNVFFLQNPHPPVPAHIAYLLFVGAVLPTHPGI